MKSQVILKTKEDTRGHEIEALVFDAYGTLFDLNSFVLECDNLYPGKGKEVLQVVKQKQFEYAWTKSLSGRYSGFDSITRNALKFALEHLRLEHTPDTVEELYTSFLRLKPYDDVEKGLFDLDQQLTVRLAILSNGTEEMLNKLIENTGLSLISEDIISVEGAQKYKPHPRAYQHGLNELNIFVKDHVFYISGNPWDVAGAKAFGLTVGWINRTSQSSFDNEFLDFPPDYEFSKLEELMKLLLTMQSRPQPMSMPH